MDKLNLKLDDIENHVLKFSKNLKTILKTLYKIKTALETS